MTTQDIKYLKGEAEAEALSYEELALIEHEFAKLPDDFLRDDRENATAWDMLDELERNNIK